MLIRYRTQTSPNHSSTDQSGFSLIELLISLVVFSIGMLGMANLQILAKAANYDAVQRTTASLVGSTLLERMRSNTGSLDGYLGTIGSGVLMIPATDCSLVVCTGAEIAAFDLYVSERSAMGFEVLRGTINVSGLVDPTVCIVGPADGTAGIYTVTVAWRGTRAHDNNLVTTCGNGVYDSENSYRRVVTFQTYIATG